MLHTEYTSSPQHPVLSPSTSPGHADGLTGRTAMLCNGEFRHSQAIYYMICAALCLFLCLPTAVKAISPSSSLDGIRFHTLSPKSFLPTTNIELIMQDSLGFIWYATSGEGLCRDDGYTVTTYSSKTIGMGVMESDEVTCLAEDKEGQIWFGTRLGIYVLDKERRSIRRVNHEAIGRRKVNCMAADGDHVWVGAGRSLVRFDLRGQGQASYYIGNDTQREVKELTVDSRGTLWMTVLRGGIYTIAPGEKELRPMPWPLSVAASYVAEDPSHRFYWVGTWGKGIVKYHPDGRIEQQDMPRGYHLFCKEVNNMVIDAKRQLMWVSTMDDLYLYSMEGERLTMLSTHAFLPQDKKLISKISADRRGNIWVPASSPKSFVLEWAAGSIRRDAVEAMSQEMGYKVMVDRVVKEGDYYWIYQRRTRLSLYNSRTGQLSFMATDAYPTPLTTQKVLSRCHDKPGVWTCSGRRLIRVWHEDMRICWAEDTAALMPTYIASLNDLGDGRLLIGTDRRVFSYDYRKGKVSQLTDSVGVVHQVGWQDGQLRYSTEPNSFPLITDSHGHIYTLTETSLTETSTKTGARRIIYAKDTGVEVDCFTHISISADTICLGGIGAFCTLTPCLALDQANPDQPILMVDSTHVTSLNHLHAPEVRYAYRFVPQDGLWRTPSSWRETAPGDNTLRFDSLSCGDYVVEVRCTDEFGRWSSAQPLTSLSVPYPWYARWYAILSFTIFALSLIAIMRAYLRRRRTAAQATTQVEGAATAASTTAANATTQTDSAATTYLPSSADSTTLPSTEATAGHTTKEASSAMNDITTKEAQLFMERLTTQIKRHIDDQSYDSERLAADMGMSRSNLYRYFQRYSSLESLTTYVRSIRLEEGRRMLLSTRLAVSEIAYKVGFSSSQYFAKCFKDAFGMSPSDYRNSLTPSPHSADTSQPGQCQK